MSKQLIAIVGPTASGKSRLAVELARRFNGEVISADSRQVYRGMDIGTAKPTAEERSAVPHHLLDLADPDQPFGLADWLEQAKAALEDIWSRGRLPLLAGGSGQYVWALLEGWQVPRVPPMPELRRELEKRLERAGLESLVAELRREAPEMADVVDRRNPRRVIRALEVAQATGLTQPVCRLRVPPTWQTLIIGLRLSREELYRRIDERVERMVADGLVEEVRGLLQRGYSRELPAMSGIGYKEVCQHLAGEIDLATAVERIKTETHRLVRHQNNWFKQSDDRIHWLEAQGDYFDQAKKLVEGFLTSPVGTASSSK